MSLQLTHNRSKKEKFSQRIYNEVVIKIGFVSALGNGKQEYQELRTSLDMVV